MACWPPSTIASYGKDGCRPSRAGSWSARRSRRLLRDGQGALHAGLAMAGHRAVERVLTRLEVGLDLRVAVLVDRGPVEVHAVRPLKRDVVRHGRRVVHHDPEGAGLARERLRAEGELAAGRGAQLERLSRGRRRWLLRVPARGGL